MKIMTRANFSGGMSSGHIEYGVFKDGSEEPFLVFNEDSKDRVLSNLPSELSEQIKELLVKFHS